MAFNKCYSIHEVDDNKISSEITYKGVPSILEVEIKNNNLTATIYGLHSNHLYSLKASLKQKGELLEIEKVMEKEGIDPYNSSLLGAFNRAHEFMKELGYTLLIQHNKTKEIRPYTGQ